MLKMRKNEIEQKENPFDPTEKKNASFLKKQKLQKCARTKRTPRSLAALVVSSSEWERLPGDTTTRSFFFFNEKLTDSEPPAVN